MDCSTCEHYSVYIHGNDEKMVIVDSCRLGEMLIPEGVKFSCPYFMERREDEE